MALNTSYFGDPSLHPSSFINTYTIMANYYSSNGPTSRSTLSRESDSNSIEKSSEDLWGTLYPAGSSSQYSSFLFSSSMDYYGFKSESALQTTSSSTDASSTTASVIYTVQETTSGIHSSSALPSNTFSDEISGYTSSLSALYSSPTSTKIQSSAFDFPSFNSEATITTSYNSLIQPNSLHVSISSEIPSSTLSDSLNLASSSENSISSLPRSSTEVSSLSSETASSDAHTIVQSSTHEPFTSPNQVSVSESMSESSTNSSVSIPYTKINSFTKGSSALRQSSTTSIYSSFNKNVTSTGIQTAIKPSFLPTSLTLVSKSSSESHPTSSATSTKLSDTSSAASLISRSTVEIISYTNSGTVYYVYTQNYDFTDATTTFATGLPTTITVAETAASSITALPVSTITTDVSVYNNWEKSTKVSSSSQKSTTSIIGGVVGGVGGLLLCSLVLYLILIWRRRRKHKKDIEEERFRRYVNSGTDYDSTYQKEEGSTYFNKNPFRNEFDFQSRIPPLLPLPRKNDNARQETTPPLFLQTTNLDRSSFISHSSEDMTDTPGDYSTVSTTSMRLWGRYDSPTTNNASNSDSQGFLREIF
ncbi:hypothetical protein KAFR_0A07500 [Kazachstania africana CBS 2517]|uniref:Mid2 domain-containing protein n=1 Tax=Kazachstania africana (strain ATCC 22294 / BCRC 22015 / CBS 2517 / CECT 1963 / NBRC 1671 / NRRL Y-8276) TaxID=1071382 RepID=H2AP84_KAZAF|nr:hypothetical protein KAFR_0A07500 [Kazachstania africana CBS 2517]CCF56184.1 hypothetical protein KAFR_0A07500 [Kazachstania africana CBS 2517]